MQKRILVCLVITAATLFLLSVSPSSTAQENPPVAATFTVYAPGKDGRLHRRFLRGMLPRFMPTAPSTSACVVTQEALMLLFRSAGSSFPPGTRCARFPRMDENNIQMQVELTRAFLHPTFWKNDGQARLALYSIVDTALQETRGGTYNNAYASLQVLVAGKQLRWLSHFAVVQPLHYRSDLIGTIKRRANKNTHRKRTSR